MLDLMKINVALVYPSSCAVGPAGASVLGSVGLTPLCPAFSEAVDRQQTGTSSGSPSRTAFSPREMGLSGQMSMAS